MKPPAVAITPPAQMRFLAIEGPIGVGKTTLARRLAETYGTELMLEASAKNPFLEKFYDDPTRFALPAQLYFLFQRVEQLQDFRQDDLFRRLFISDYMLDKDRIFAALTLDHAEFEMYCLVYERIVDSILNPDLVIYLQAQAPTLLRRIARRGLRYEEGIDRAYLDRLGGRYVEFFRGYDRAPVLVVDTEDINFGDNEAHYAALLKTIAAGVRGTQYFVAPKLMG